MSYTLLAVLGVMLAVGVDQLVLRTRLLRRKGYWTAYAIIVCFQLIVNGVLTGIPIVRYDPERIIGWRIAYAPVEDLLFGFALVTITLSLWVFSGRSQREADG
jgi:lycopene cyclase domain-containing protein